MSVNRSEGDGRCRRLRLLGDVLERFQAGEVERSLRPLGKAPHPVGQDLRRQGDLSSLGVQGGWKALVGEQRGMDPAREVAQVVQGVANLGLRPLRASPA
jgi:hypothetical protein